MKSVFAALALSVSGWWFNVDDKLS